MAPTRPRLSQAVVVLLASQLVPGCSWFLLETAPPPDKRNTLFYCNKSMGIPALDGFLATAAFGNGVCALARDSSDYQGKTHSKASDIALSVVVGALFMIATGTGCSAVNECREVSPNIPIAPAALPAASAPVAPRAGFDPARAAPAPAAPAPAAPAPAEPVPAEPAQAPAAE